MARFIRVKSRATGHQFDVPDTHPALATGALERLSTDRFPPAARPRQPKHRAPRAKPAQAPPALTDTPDTSVAGDSPSRPAGPDATRKEADHG